MKMTPKLMVPIVSILSILSAFLFYKSPLGINFPLFSFVGVGCLMIISAIYKKFHFQLLFNGILLVLVSIPLAVTTALPIRFACIVTSAFLVFTGIYALFQKASDFPFWRYFTGPIELAVMSLISPILAVTNIRINTAKTPTKLIRVLAGFIVSLPILCVFILLLSSADLVFQDLLQNIVSGNFITDAVLILLWIAIFAWGLFGVLYYVLFMKSPGSPQTAGLTNSSTRFLIEGATILILVEILFLVFNAIQITYLFGGETLIKNGEYTYAEYARRGFFELVLVSIIALFLIAVVYKLVKTRTKLQGIFIRVVSIVGILELFPMAISAFYKLYMYEQEFGYTRLRMYSHLFIVLLMLIFVWFVVKFVSRISERLFLYGVQLIIILFVTIVGFLNTDGFIADYNIQRSENDGKELDLEYLQTLSYDAVPRLVEYLREEDEDSQKELAHYLKSYTDRLEYDFAKQDIRSINYRALAARKYLKDNEDRIRILHDSYTEEIGQKYFKRETTNSLRRDCDGKKQIIYLNPDGSLIYTSAIRVYAENNPRYFVEETDSYGCIDLSGGSYFILAKTEYSFGSSDVYKIEIDSSERVFIVRRPVSGKL